MKPFLFKNIKTEQLHKLTKLACLIVYPFVLLVGNKLSFFLGMYILIFPLLEFAGAASITTLFLDHQLLNTLIDLLIIGAYYYFLCYFINSATKKTLTKKNSLTNIIAIVVLNSIPFLSALNGYVFDDLYGMISNGVFLSLSIVVILFEIRVIKNYRKLTSQEVKNIGLLEYLKE